MITRENVMWRRAFVTCNRGKTSNRDTIVGNRIPGRTEERTKSLRDEHGRGLALTFVKTVKERLVFPRRVFEPAWGTEKDSCLYSFLRAKGRISESRSSWIYLKKNPWKFPRRQEPPATMTDTISKRMNCKYVCESCISYENPKFPSTNLINLVKSISCIEIIVWIFCPFDKANIYNINDWKYWIC